MIQIVKADLNEISSFRSDYLNSLPAFQELYLELFVNDSAIYKIDFDNTSIGYVLITPDNILIEYYLINRFVPLSSVVFQTIIETFSVTTIYCKSFDPILLNCCLMKSCSYKLIGTLFREYIPAEKFVMDGLSIRFANQDDYSFLLQQEGELYETPEELEKFVSGNNVIMFQKEGKLLGCGYLIKVHADYNYYDIGMWVNQEFRKQGVATMIISYLKDTCITNNWRPICGCAIGNSASQKTLEKNGFVSKYKLIEFTI